jgi:hypothetical protein
VVLAVVASSIQHSTAPTADNHKAGGTRDVVDVRGSCGVLAAAVDTQGAHPPLHNCIRHVPG